MVEKTAQLPPGWEGKEELTRETKKIARQLAMVHYNYAKAILEELGERRGTALIRKVVKNIAIERGQAMKKEAAKLNIPITEENMRKVSDLPKFTFPPQGHIGAVFCPYAEYWKEKGPEGQKIGILWCDMIDPWKVRAFLGPGYKLWRYGKNLNYGDDCCGEHIPLTEEEAKKQEKL